MKTKGKNRGARPVPGCESCIERDSCAEAENGKFCPKWHSQEPEAREPDPNEQWMRGEDADLADF